MKHVSILLLHHVNLAGMENARQGFIEANAYLEQQGQPPVFEVDLVGQDHEVRLDSGLYTIEAGSLVNEVQETDLIIIPPVQKHLTAEAIKENRGFCSWIRNKRDKGAEVASLCLGAFILGTTGLLNGKSCVTHWQAAHDFRKLFPEIKLVPDKILTDEDGIYTGGGAFSSANLVLYLIEKHVGKEAAIYCSKIFQIDMGRNSQSPFIIFKGQKDHGDVHIKQVQDFIEAHYHDKITVEELCEKFNLGRRTMERRFKKATSNTVVEYIQRVKVEGAKRELENGHKTVNEVMFDVGYSDTKAFRNVFRKYAGMSPADYRMKHVQIGVASL